MNILLVSPHSDDIAFSMDTFIDQKLDGHVLTLATIFGKTNYTENGFGDTEVVSVLREEEDKAYVNSKKGKIKSYVSFDFEDACVRFNGSFNLIDALNMRDDSVVFLSELKDNMKELIKDFKINAAFLPCAFGHKDHYVIREIVSGMCSKVAYYSDFPYWVHSSGDFRYFTISKLMGDVKSTTITVEDTSKKIAAVSKYSSQMNKTLLDMFSKIKTEEIWARTPFWEDK